MEKKIMEQTQFEQLIENAYRVSKEAGVIVEQALSDAINKPMTKVEAERFLVSIIEKIKVGAANRNDKETVHMFTLEVRSIVERAMKMRERIIEEELSAKAINKIVELSSFNGKGPAIVHPRPTFHRREIPMNSGGVKTTDISLWDRNERLDIHVGQFKVTQGRDPNSSELLDIMLSKMPLNGLDSKDQFKIEELARSIANNGVRKPPIIDIDGTLLDGNRRVAACYFILNSDNFDSEQKKRAENIFVWQLTEHAGDEDREAVVISLNFEPDSKQDWPEYVKAKIIYEHWEAMLTREIIPPGPTRITKLKRDLSSKFGYGEDPYMANRYIKMVMVANEFEDYLMKEKGHDIFAIKHQASRYFQYFDELSKGTNAGGVAYTLNQNEQLKHVVFDLLFQGKIKNWTLIRSLKHYNDDVMDSLVKAREISEVETAEDLVEDKLNEAKSQERGSRVGNPNQRIEVFSKWLEQLPISAFRDDINPKNLKRLLDALHLVERQVKDLNLKETTLKS
jgi:hypothetical protein